MLRWGTDERADIDSAREWSGWRGGFLPVVEETDKYELVVLND